MIKSENVMFGPIIEKILPVLFNFRNDPELYKNFRQYRPLSMEEHIGWFRSLHKNPFVQMFVIGIKDEICGVCGLTSIDRVNSRAELSCYVIKKYEEFEEEALRLLIKYAFEKENLHSVYADVFETNDKKIDIMHKITSNWVVLRDRYFREGKYIDSHLFTVLR